MARVSAQAGTRLGLVLLCLPVAGCTDPARSPSPPPVGPVTATPHSADTFDCGTVDLRAGTPKQRSRRLGVADVCLRDALTIGQPARLVRVGGDSGLTVRTTYVVTGRGEVAVAEDAGGRVRLRRCTNATGLFLLGTCTREPGSGR